MPRKSDLAATDIGGIAVRLEDAIASGMDLSGNVAVCGVDNNPARTSITVTSEVVRVSKIFA